MVERRELFPTNADLDRTRRFVEESIGLAPRSVGDGRAAGETGDYKPRSETDFESEELAGFSRSSQAEQGRGVGAVGIPACEGRPDETHECVDHGLADWTGELLTKPRKGPWDGRISFAHDPGHPVFEHRARDE